MEDISRKDIDRIVQLLANHVNTEESIRLAKALTDADVIPKLYQRAYVESLYLVMSKCKTVDAFEENYNFGYEKYILKSDDIYNAVLQILHKAHERQDEVCDFADSPLPETKIGRCEDDDHIENCEGSVELTEEEQELFNKLNEDDDDPWEHFEDKINPPDQHLTLILDYNDDETKVRKDHGHYVCDTCLDVIIDNSDGAISCDMDLADE